MLKIARPVTIDVTGRCQTTGRHRFDARPVKTPSPELARCAVRASPRSPAVADRTRSAARSVSRPRALADLSRPHPVQHRELDHDPQLRLQRRHRDLRLHLRLHRGLRLWPRHARARLRRRRRPHPASAPGRSTSRTSSCSRSIIAEIAYVTPSFDNPLYAEEMNMLDFLKQSGRHDHPGAAAEVQAGQHGRAAALHRAAAAVSADPVAAAAQRRRWRSPPRSRSMR